MFLPLSPSPQHFDIETRDERRGISIRDAGRRKKTFVSPVEVVENSEGRGGGRDARSHCSSSTRRIFPRFPLSGFQLGDDGFAGINSNSAFSCQRVERVAKKKKKERKKRSFLCTRSGKKSSPRGSRPRIIFSPRSYVSQNFFQDEKRAFY